MPTPAPPPALPPAILPASARTATSIPPCPPVGGGQLSFALAQLRHAYAQLLRGAVVDQAGFAKGLIGPAIARIEESQR